MQCRYGVYVALLLGCLQACEKRLPDDMLVARINGKPITKDAYEAQVALNVARYGGSGQALPPGTETRIRESVLKRMVQDEIVRQKAAALGLKLEDEKLQTRFAELKAHFRTDEAFQDYLKRSSNTESNVRDDIALTMLRDMVIDKLASNQPVTAEVVEKHYQDNAMRYLEPEQRHVQRILWPIAANSSPAELQAYRKKIEKHATMLRKQPEKLEQLLQNGGQNLDGAVLADLGHVRSEKSDAVIQAAFAASGPGFASDLVTVPQGLALVHVKAIQPARQKPFDEAREDIKRLLELKQQNDQKRQVLAELEKTATIEMLYKPGNALGAAPGIPPTNHPNSAGEPGHDGGAVPHLVDKPQAGGAESPHH